MVKYYKYDLWWVVGLIGANMVFYGLNSTFLHYVILNLEAGIAMVSVGIAKRD